MGDFGFGFGAAGGAGAGVGFGAPAAGGFGGFGGLGGGTGAGTGLPDFTSGAQNNALAQWTQQPAGANAWANAGAGTGTAGGAGAGTGAAGGTGAGTTGWGTGGTGGFDLGSIGWGNAGSGAAAQPAFGAAFGAAGTVFVKPSTKYMEAPEAYKKKYVELENYIQSQRKIRDEIADDLKKPIPKEFISVDTLNDKLQTLSRDIQKESAGLSVYIDKVRGELKYAEQASRAMAKTKQQQRMGAASPFNTTVPLPSQYHWEKLAAFSDSVERIARQIDEVDQYLIANEASLGAGGLSRMTAANPKAFQQILTAQHTALYSLTSRVAQLHTLCDELRDKYRKFKTAEAPAVRPSNGYYPYPAAGRAAAAAAGSGGGASSLYEKVAGGGGSADALFAAPGAIMFDGENDDAPLDPDGLGGLSRRRPGAGPPGTADPLSELSFLNTNTSTSLVPQPVPTATQAQQQAAAQASQLAGAGGTAAAGTAGGTGFDLFGAGTSFGSTGNLAFGAGAGTGAAAGGAAGQAGPTFPSFGAPPAAGGTGAGAPTQAGQAGGAIPALNLGGTAGGFGGDFSFGAGQFAFTGT